MCSECAITPAVTRIRGGITKRHRIIKVSLSVSGERPWVSLSVMWTCPCL